MGEAAADATGAIGAKAYATGNQLAFAAQPYLHTAAHAAAHLVQQRGGVHLSGGVSRNGDRYEQHAEAVSDAVVAGCSAQALLAPLAKSGAPAAGVQRQVPPVGGPPAGPLPPVERCLDGQDPFTRALAKQAMPAQRRSCRMCAACGPAAGSAERTSEIDANAYQETEMYSLMREVEFYTPNAPKDRAALDSIHYDPAPTIATRIGLIKIQFEARVARSIVRGLYQRYRMDPRLVPAAIAAFTAGVRSNFSTAEAAQTLR